MRAIKRSEKFEDMVRRLAESSHPDAGRQIFPTMRELMCFAAVLGYESEKRRPLDAKVLEIDGRVFLNSQQALDLIYLLALAAARDVEILREEQDDRAIQIFEEYAQGGFEILEAWLKEKPEDPNGDQAILAALSKYKYLQPSEDVNAVISDISF